MNVANRKQFLCGVWVLLLLPVIPAVLNAWLNPKTPSWNPMQLAEGEVALQDLEEWPGDFLLVDARDPQSFNEAHMPEAINLYAGEFDAQILDVLDVWSPEMSLIVYCDSRQCGASEEMAKRLRNDFQMDKVYVLKGGWESWLSASDELQLRLGGHL